VAGGVALGAWAGRARSQRGPDELIPEDVLLAEVEHYFDMPDVWAPEQWFARRLAGTADNQEQRDALATEIHAELHERHHRGNRRRPIGLLDWPRITHRSRRGEPPRQALEDERSTDEA
jgi:hypothetical protein